ncbi:hypothetical protein [Aureliella helgolandensis]|nr:hypothetical protein [Aureliella helgolandensis]
MLQTVIPEPDEQIDSLVELREWIKTVMNPPDWANAAPVGLPWGPGDILGGGSAGVDVLIDFIVNAGVEDRACNKWFKKMLTGIACATAKCDRNKCAGFYQTGHGTGTFNDCLDEVAEIGTKRRLVAEPFMRDKVAGALTKKCRDSATNGPCCKNGGPKAKKDCPIIGKPPFVPRRPCCIAHFASVS